MTEQEKRTSVGSDRRDPRDDGSALSPIAVGYTFLLLLCGIALSAMPEDLDRIEVMQFGTIHFYVIDLIYSILLISAGWVFLSGVRFGRSSTYRLYTAFLIWLGVCVCLGYLDYGYRAIGEARYVLAFLAFFLPYVVIGDPDRLNIRRLRKIIIVAVTISAVTSLIMFFSEIIHGGRLFFSTFNQKELGIMEDFRGVRYLGSTQTFNILALAAFLSMEALTLKKTLRFTLTVIALLVFVSLLTKNRAAILSVSLAVVLFLLLQGKLRQLLMVLLVCVCITFAFSLLLPDLMDGVYTALISTLDPFGDETASYRLRLNAAAIEQGLESPYIGHGFGGYFYFLVPGGPPIEDPPHNEFILLFVKTGLAGVLLVTWTLSVYCLRLRRLARTEGIDGGTTLLASWLLVICLSQFIYGMAYGFIPLFGFYVGCAELLLSISSNSPIRGSEYPSAPPDLDERPPRSTGQIGGLSDGLSPKLVE